MKPCKDCKHFQPNPNTSKLDLGLCAAPGNTMTNPVSGELVIGRTGFRFAEVLRVSALTGCGPEARWYEPTPERVEPPAESKSWWKFWA
jgi:hypothetical protein